MGDNVLGRGVVHLGLHFRNSHQKVPLQLFDPARREVETNALRPQLASDGCQEPCFLTKLTVRRLDVGLARLHATAGR